MVNVHEHMADGRMLKRKYNINDTDFAKCICNMNMQANVNHNKNKLLCFFYVA